jgi:signal transduction histidine kinase
MSEVRRQTERWIAWVRLGGVVFAVLEIGLLTSGFPPGYEAAAWTVTAIFAAGAFAIFFAAERVPDERLPVFGLAALAFDTAVICAYSITGSWEYGSPTRFALVLAVAEAALRYGRRGGVALPVALVPFLAYAEWWRADHFGPPDFLTDRITLPFGILLLAGLIVGWLVRRFEASAELAAARAVEAEELRDLLGRRVDVLEAANRCSRALGSSLELEKAFGAFIREVGGVVPFERIAVVLAEGDEIEVLASSGGELPFRRGGRRRIEASIAEPTLRGQTTYRTDMHIDTHPDEVMLVEQGLRSRLAAPLLAGTHTVGVISFMRSEVGAFTAEEVELVTLLGRLAGTAIQNIRAFEAERRTVEELRRLSALRADFVSLVSHELRSPMAAVIGSARTLQARWRELQPEQRESFLALIADETSRLAALIGDVLDTSRIEAGTFSYAFDDVDLAGLVEEAVATAAVGQDEVHLVADVPPSLPPVRADRARLRQVLGNLIDNAVKYSDAGSEVNVRASAHNGVVRVEVRDSGPGIPAEQQGLIFEKFGRAKGHGAKPGSGLGLFIARSIAEAHGGSVEVRSAPGEGATFTLSLPAG